MVIAAVDQGSGDAVVELQQGGAASFGRPRGIEHARRRAHAAGEPAGEVPRGVDLVRHLVEQDAAAPFGVELFRPARAIEEVGVVEAVNETEPAEVAAPDDLMHQPHRRIEGVGVADHEMHLVALHRRDDGVAVGQRQRHRLFQDDVLAVLGRKRRVRRMKLVRGGDVDDVDLGIGHQLSDVGIGPGVEVAGEGFARPGIGIGRGPQHETRMGRRGMHHHRASHAEAGDAEPDRVEGPADFRAGGAFLCAFLGHCRIAVWPVFLCSRPKAYPPSLESPSRHGHEDC